MRWLCLDPGTKRTGVAISSPEGTFAVPLLVLEHDEAGPSVDRLALLLSEHRAEGLVIGLPLFMDGTSSTQTRAALELARRVAEHFHAVLEMPPDVSFPESGGCADSVPPASAMEVMRIRVLLWDERLSSWDAQRMVMGNGAPGRKRTGKKQALDAHAAAVILQSFLDSQAGAPVRDGLSDDADDERDGPSD